MVVFKEKEIQKLILKKLPKLIFGIEIVRVRSGNKSTLWDLAIQVRMGKVSKWFICEIKSRGEPLYLYQAIGRLRQAPRVKKGDYPVIITSSISEQGQKICKEAGVGYVDLAGNIFLKFDSVLIEKASTQRIIPELRPAGNPFAPKASRLLRVLLENSKKTWTFSRLSQASQTNLRTTFNVISLLSEKGLIEKKRGAIALIKPGDLLDYWAQNYGLKKNRIQTFFSFARSFEEFLIGLKKAASGLKIPYALTLHSGASLVAPYVRFSDVHLYISGEVKPWIKRLDLRPAESGGTIHLISPYDEGVFYNKQEIDGAWIVGNIQLYLDLYRYPARGREQADFLRRQKIGF